MVKKTCTDILGICELFLEAAISDNQVAIDGFGLIRKDRADTHKKKNWWPTSFVLEEHF